MTITTPLSLTVLSARLKGSTVLRGNAIPQALREKGAVAVYFETEPGARFRVIFEGLRTSWRPSMEVEGTGKIVEESSGGSIIRVDVRPKTSSLWRVGITIAVFLALMWYNLIIDDPPNRLAWAIPVFLLFFVSISWVQVKALTDRVEAGLMVAVRRLLLEGDND